MALSALRRKRSLPASASYHTQQCAEKYLKAILVSRQRPFPKTHDLRLLSTLCTEAGALLEIDIDRLDALSFYAVHARYPGNEPTPEQAGEALTTCRAVRKLARRWLGL